MRLTFFPKDDVLGWSSIHFKLQRLNLWSKKVVYEMFKVSESSKSCRRGKFSNPIFIFHTRSGKQVDVAHMLQ